MDIKQRNATDREDTTVLSIPEWAVSSQIIDFQAIATISGYGQINLSNDLSPWRFQSEAQWASKVLGVSESKYLNWKKWILAEDRHQCQAFKVNGERCKESCHARSENVHDFDPKSTPYCRHHKDPRKRISAEEAFSIRAGKTQGSKGFVYLLKAAGTSRFKVGLSIEPSGRALTIGRQSPFPIEVVTCYGVDDMRSEEQMWHKKFEDSRVFGEWFELSLSQVEAFTSKATEVK